MFTEILRRWQGGGVVDEYLGRVWLEKSGGLRGDKDLDFSDCVVGGIVLGGLWPGWIEREKRINCVQEDNSSGYRFLLKSGILTSFLFKICLATWSRIGVIRKRWPIGSVKWELSLNILRENLNITEKWSIIKEWHFWPAGFTIGHVQECLHKLTMVAE
jgi:hypothetical protein